MGRPPRGEWGERDPFPRNAAGSLSPMGDAGYHRPAAPNALAPPFRRR
jgi:hypothetical protein